MTDCVLFIDWTLIFASELAPLRFILQDNTAKDRIGTLKASPQPIGMSI